jgi:hypothetical protein
MFNENEKYKEENTKIRIIKNKQALSISNENKFNSNHSDENDSQVIHNVSSKFILITDKIYSNHRQKW